MQVLFNIYVINILISLTFLYILIHTIAKTSLMHSIYHIRNTNYERHFYFCYRQGMYLTRYEKDLVKIVCNHLGVPCTLEDEAK